MNKQFQKVIDGLAACGEFGEACGRHGWMCDTCPYGGEACRHTDMLMEAHELLKEYDSALRGMVYQYCTAQKQFLKGKDCDMPNQEVFFHSFMSAGETAFKALGIENGQEVSEDFIWS